MSNAGYSQIKHIARALFGPHDPNSVFMVMLTAYFDASASHIKAKSNARVMTVAGFVSTEQKWSKHENEWNSILKKYGVTNLHMKNFTVSQGEFKTWKGKEDLRKNFLLELLTVIKRTVHKGFAVSLLIDDFATVNANYRLKEECGSPYCVAGCGVIAGAMRWKKKRFPHAPILYIFEDGDLDSNDLRKRLKKDNVPYTFLPKKNTQNGEHHYVVPFQMADFLAWEVRNVWEKHSAGELGQARKSLKALWSQIPSTWKIVDKDGLIRLCKLAELER